MPTFAGHPHSYDRTSRAAVHPFRHFPLDPSDTDYEALRIPPALLSVDPATDMTSVTGHYLGASERTRYQPQRTPTLAYQNSGPRDFRDRGYSRSSRNVVVVIPPPDLPLDQRRLGNVLSVGPRHRLSEGILMPLFPSMLGQLSAIAREYNFPSTIGLCLYLHINENNMKMSPRISDDSWQYLFGHLFDGHPSSGGRQLPIGGSIEFDIDLDKARWFDTWISGTLRDSEPVFPPVATSWTSLEARWRRECQAANGDERPVEDRWNASGSHTLGTNSRREALRHLPKKLSLVDRLESHVVRAPLKTQGYPDHPESSPTHGTYASSPILQSTIPQVMEGDLERRVNSWRATTELHPPSMVQTYQPVPDVGVSTELTIMDEYALACNLRQAVRVDEFVWSITSVGSRSPPTEPFVPSPRPSSIRLDRCAKATVSPTPTTVTSWGPADDEWESVVSSITRLPSPDIGERVVEDVMAPRPRAVWGNSFGWRTAMTWKLVYPCSLIQKKPTIRVQPEDSNGFVPQHPNLMIYPSMTSEPDSRSLLVSELQRASPQAVWNPENMKFAHEPWHMVWPFFRGISQIETPLSESVFVSGYPYLVIYPPVYPHFELYPACTLKNEATGTLTNSKDAYPSVYPYFDIYPVDDLQIEKPSGSISNVLHEPAEVRLASLYPNFDIYPACYPYNLDSIYPFISATRSTQMLTEASHVYPRLVVYPPVCPFTMPYPGSSAEISQPLEPESSFSPSSSMEQKLVDVKLHDRYPSFCIYPLVYPFVQPYPSESSSIHVPGALDEDGYASAKASLASSELGPFTLGSAVYPYFDLYPPPPTVEPQQWRAAQGVYVGDLTSAPPQAQITKRGARMTHMELHASVFRSLGKRRARVSKTHLQLHTEVFQDGVVWTPSGYMQGLTSLLTMRLEEMLAPEPQPPRRSRSRSGTTTAQSPERTVFPLVQPPALPPIPPLRVRSPGIPSQPPPAVAETPVPRLPSPTSTYTHMRTTSARLSQAVKSMVPRVQRRNSNAATASPPSKDRKEHPKSPTRFLSLIDRRPTVVPPISHANTSEFLTRAPRNTQPKESPVLQRSRAREQAVTNQCFEGTNETHSPFVLPSLPSMPSMTGVAEVIEKSKITFP